MAETLQGAATARSPFEGHVTGDRPNVAGNIGVRLCAGTLPAVFLISTWPTGAAALAQALAQLLGMAPGASVAGRTGETLALASGLLVRSGPEEFLLFADAGQHAVASLRAGIPAHTGSVTDLSHARCAITILGEKSQDTLSKLFALDLREREFPLGQARLTGHHHVPCLLHRRSVERFDIYVFSTYAFDQLHTLVDAALEYGVGLQLSSVWTPSTM